MGGKFPKGEVTFERKISYTTMAKVLQVVAEQEKLEKLQKPVKKISPVISKEETLKFDAYERAKY